MIADEPARLTVLSSTTVHEGLIWDVRRDEVDLGDGQQVTREVVVHTGAVGIIALDEQDRVLLVRQYRHPVRSFLWEPPAGLLDVAGEDPLDAARRELAEEADLRADEWHLLVDYYNSPGGSTESFRCYLARGLHDVPHDQRHDRHGEERDMATTWVALDDARDLVLAGRLHNPTAVCGVLAACAARDSGWSSLRPADTPGPSAHPAASDTDLAAGQDVASSGAEVGDVDWSRAGAPSLGHRGGRLVGDVRGPVELARKRLVKAAQTDPHMVSAQ